MLENFLPIILLGLIHGLEPGHGWPVATLYALKQRNKFGSAFLSALIISFFHFISSIAVVVVFIFANQQFDLASSPIVRVVAVLLLLFMAYRFWMDHSHLEKQKKVKNLAEIAGFAFVLGFAHEEEFALLAFCLNNVDCLLLMASYATAVTVSLVGITLASTYAYKKIEHKMRKYEHYLPKISAIILVIFAILFAIKML